MLERAAQHQPDSNDYIMAAFVCVKGAVLCVFETDAVRARQSSWLSYRDLPPESKNTRVSVSGTHSLLSSLSHSCINTLTHTERRQESRYPKQDGYVWVVRSQRDILFLTASSQQWRYLLYIWAACQLGVFVGGASKCVISRGCSHLIEWIIADGAGFYTFYCI